MKEIGGEFWSVETTYESQFFISSPHLYLLSGRTALDYVIRDMKASVGINMIYMPSYCCHTMIDPFLKNGIKIVFYDVGFKDGNYYYELDYNTSCDTVLILKYFGYDNANADYAINVLKGKGKKIIEDATHSWFLENPYSSKADYIYASLRKWTGLACGGIAIRQNERFSIEAPDQIYLEPILLRKKAATLKRNYIENGIGEKEEFLNLFSEAESLFDQHYQNSSIPKEEEFAISHLDTRRIRNGRKENAEYLISGIVENKELETVILGKNDAPLFVPVIVNNDQRNNLQQYLIENNIYCPAHWPISKEHKSVNEFLYKHSLSIVCDQRYDLSEMKKILDCINSYYRRK